MPLPSIGPEAHITELVRIAGPLAAYRRLIAENDALIRSPELDHGRVITTARTAIHTTLVAEWAAEQVRAFGYEMPFLARRRLATFSRGVIERELHVGRRVAPGHPIVFGTGGLHHTPLHRTSDVAEASKALALINDKDRFEH